MSLDVWQGMTGVQHFLHGAASTSILLAPSGNAVNLQILVDLDLNAAFCGVCG